MNIQGKRITRKNLRRIRLKTSHDNSRLRSAALFSASAYRTASRPADRAHINRHFRRLLTANPGFGIPHAEFQRIISAHNIFSRRKMERKLPAVLHRRIVSLVSRNIGFRLQIAGLVRYKRPLRHNR